MHGTFKARQGAHLPQPQQGSVVQDVLTSTLEGWLIAKMADPAGARASRNLATFSPLTPECQRKDD